MWFQKSGQTVAAILDFMSFGIKGDEKAKIIVQIQFG